MRKLSLLIFVFYALNAAFAQYSPEEELLFAKHLLQNKQYAQAIKIYSPLWNAQPQSQGLGIAVSRLHAKLGQHDSVLLKLNRFEQKDSLAYLLLFYGSRLALQQPVQARKEETSRFEGVNMLQSLSFAQKKDWKNYALSDIYAYTRSDMQAMQLQLNKEVLAYQKIPRKSPMLAGLMSAVLPGLGKVYTGRAKQGISPLLSCITLGAQSYDIYKKLGYKHPLFWSFAGLTSVFYAANIYGSAKSARIYNQAKTQKFNEIFYAHSRHVIDAYLP